MALGLLANGTPCQFKMGSRSSRSKLNTNLTIAAARDTSCSSEEQCTVQGSRCVQITSNERTDIGKGMREGPNLMRQLLKTGIQIQRDFPYQKEHLHFAIL